MSLPLTSSFARNGSASTNFNQRSFQNTSTSYSSLNSNYTRNYGSPSTNPYQRTHQTGNGQYHNLNSTRDYINRNNHFSNPPSSSFTFNPPPSSYNVTYIPPNNNYNSYGVYSSSGHRRAGGFLRFFFVVCAITAIFVFIARKR